jgi:predicted transposase YbfD/YdcC
VSGAKQSTIPTGTAGSFCERPEVKSLPPTHHRLHRRVDMVMNEDQDRSGLGNAPNTLAVLRHMAINVMQKDPSKGSLRGKFKRAA